MHTISEIDKRVWELEQREIQLGTYEKKSFELWQIADSKNKELMQMWMLGIITKM
ncbi:MAG: hypothetical protein HOD60_04230 [Candidatus Nitrosopelagicus sp.]|nr:hypothetical protein [Candidatus Nitrosopelagicus sp.]